MRKRLVVLVIGLVLLVGVPSLAVCYYKQAGTPYYAHIERSHVHDRQTTYQLKAYGANGQKRTVVVHSEQHHPLRGGQFIKILWTRHYGVKQYQLIDASEIPFAAYRPLIN